ncbi:MAG: hypothetical protein QOF81_2815 [Acidimicrobiaceae bacterium]|nr:hypothetical protein [Acidimicrobiaceae bacterium]
MSHRGSFPWAPVAAIGVAVALLAGGAMTVMLGRDSGSGRPLTLSNSTAHSAGAAGSSKASNAPQSPPADGGGAGVVGAAGGSGGASSTGAGGGTAATATAKTGTGARSPAPTVAGGHQGAATPSTQSPTSAKQSPVLAGPTAAAPGTYRYRQSGTLAGTPAEGTLVVAPVSGSGTQVWTRKVGGTVPASTSVMLFNATGSYLVSPGGQTGGAPAACTFNAPVPWPPWPTTPGRTYAAQATCSGPVSSYQATGRVQGTATLSLDGHAVNTSIVVNTFVLKGSYAGSPLTMTLTETDYYSPTLRVPVVTRTHVVGSALGLPVSTDRTDILESATAS